MIIESERNVTNTQVAENNLFSSSFNRVQICNNSDHKQNCDRPPSFQQNNSPFVIKKSSNVLDSNFSLRSKNISAINNLNKNYKIYSPSPNNIVKEKLSDRFIPINKGLNLQEKFELSKERGNKELSNEEECKKGLLSGEGTNANYDMYNNLLENNFFSENAYDTYISNSQFINSNPHHHKNLVTPVNSKIFSFRKQHKKKSNDLTKIRKCLNFDCIDKENINNFSRKITNRPYKLIEVPGLLDDFYLNLIDWSIKNDIAVGQANSLYLWCANKTQCVKLFSYENDKYVSSLIWNSSGTELAVGNSDGIVEIWDVTQKKLIRILEGHSARVSVVAWKNDILSTGSKDYSILNRDLRISSNSFSKYLSHKQEVCGLKWSFDGTQLASGGNDNKLMIWNLHSNQPIMKSSVHTAAVKAIAWSPHQNNLLASGGGTADRCIRFWNTSIFSQINCIDTGSQVCNLMFSKTVNELISTHGYSLNQINVWKLPSFTKLATLTGHTYRVLYLGMSPDGQNIVTGAGDQTLRFWNIFPPVKTRESSCLFPSNNDMR